MTISAKPNVVSMVVGDTGRPLRLSITDPATKQPVDVSNATVVALMREVGGSTLLTIPCSKLAGIVRSNRTINTNPPYNVPGAGGRVQVDWTEESVANHGKFKLEIRITFDTGKVLTLHRLLDVRFRSRL